MQNPRAHLSKASEWRELELQSLGSVQGQHSEGFSPVHFHPFSICSPWQPQLCRHNLFLPMM